MGFWDFNWLNSRQPATPPDPAYAAQQSAEYYAQHPVRTDITLKEGDRYQVVEGLRGRLNALGLIHGAPPADPAVYDSTMTQAVRDFQEAHNRDLIAHHSKVPPLHVTGIADGTTLSAFNAAIAQRAHPTPAPSPAQAGDMERAKTEARMAGVRGQALYHDVNLNTTSPRQYGHGVQSLTALDTAQITQESGWKPEIVSSKNCIGLMQVDPKTGVEWAHSLGIKAPDGSPIDASNIEAALKDPAINVRIGHAYQQWLLNDKAHGNLTLAIAAYNAGPTRIFGYTDPRTGKHTPGWVETIGDPRNGTITNEEWMAKIPIDETRKYVGNVLSMAEHNATEYEKSHQHTTSPTQRHTRTPAHTPG